MKCRALVVGLLLALAPPLATAQEPAPVTATPAPPTATLTPAPDSIAAGRDVFHALVIGSGLMEMVLDPMMAEMMPQMRSSLLTSPLYLTVSQRHRNALMAFLDTMPQLLRDELTREINTIAERGAPRLAERMTVEELTGLAAFLRDPAARPLFERIAGEHLTVQAGGEKPSGEPEFTPEEISALADFMTTPGGVAFVREGEAITTIMDEEFAASTARLRPRLENAILSGVCQALENECPRALRDRIGAT